MRGIKTERDMRKKLLGTKITAEETDEYSDLYLREAQTLGLLLEAEIERTKAI